MLIAAAKEYFAETGALNQCMCMACAGPIAIKSRPTDAFSIRKVAAFSAIRIKE